ncbi:peptide MFS transporter [Saccharothrix coeruleofusca]|uniref:Transporter YclF n=1 Tax=Saccharothrix coeruleofusca TaxID=33919 RepID=A0A918APY8_9PSEU|nr:peptide MFS transporter [Saccharothrix coeruleofusca]MBP2337096.1 POT family proton-dependent oligopeptide transporter [Saccharothrix coeruleofusca]GGP67176.1 putative transporter YclF [Saccharothrix coeruleofusca]
MSATSAVTAPRRGFFGHPRGLSTLFFTELWERFSYYGMKAILAYYLYRSTAEGALGLDKSFALSLVAIYGAAVYMSGIAGGWLADRVLGGQRAVFHGGVLIMLGHVALAMPIGVAGVYTGLILIVLGTGLLKPNISTVVGGLYAESDPRRDSGFTIFYMGINLGGFLAPLVCGFLGENYDWHLGFGAAAVGMALGLVQYRFGRRYLGGSAMNPPNPLPVAERGRVLGRITAITLAAVAAVVLLLVTGVLGAEGVINLISVASVALPVCYFAVMLRSRKTTSVERSRLVAYIPLFVAAVMFWLLFEQSATVIAAFADTRVDTRFLGLEFPPSFVQSINPVMIIVIAPLFALLWTRLGSRQPATPRKFAYSLLLVGLSFLLMMVASQGDPAVRVGFLWLVAMYLVMTCGELLLSPVGLSVTTKLAPRAFASQTMGLWFLASAAGQGIGAVVVRFYSDENAVTYFGVLGGVAIALGVLLAVSTGRIRKLMHGVG